jgi:DNA-binding PadR family transcriptional regulator
MDRVCTQHPCEVTSMPPADRSRTRPDDRPPLKPVVFLVLLSLAAGDRHGYALKKDVAARTRDSVRLGPATLYRTLAALLDDGFIEVSGRRPAAELDDERRRYYRITAFGKAVARAETQRLAELLRLARVSGFSPRRT